MYSFCCKNILVSSLHVNMFTTEKERLLILVSILRMVACCLTCFVGVSVAKTVLTLVNQANHSEYSCGLLKFGWTMLKSFSIPICFHTKYYHFYICFKTLNHARKLKKSCVSCFHFFFWGGATMFALKTLFFRERNGFNQNHFQLCLNQICVSPEESESTLYWI